MKLRLKDNSVRFRITLKELEALHKNHYLEKETWMPGLPGLGAQVFRYAIHVSRELGESRLVAEPCSMTAELSLADFEVLSSSEEEGVYIRREWEDDHGQTQRFMFFVEKDRPSSTCEKPEEWIYEERTNQRPRLQSIPSKGK